MSGGDGIGLVDVVDALEQLDLKNVHLTGRYNVGFCVDPEARILTRSLEWVRAGDLRVGDGLWGFDENPKPGEVTRYWRNSVVLGCERVNLPCSRVRLSDGTSVVVSDDHMWLTGARGARKSWKRTTSLRAGSSRLSTKLNRILPTWSHERSWEAGWLAGVMDGEGCLVQRKGRVQIDVYQNQGDVLDRIRWSLDAFGFENTEYRNGERLASNVRLRGGVVEVASFLGSIRPIRLLSKLDLDGIPMRSESKPSVVSVESVGVQEVVALSTSTKTFLCEGLASHNSCPRTDGHSFGDANPSNHISREWPHPFRCKSCGWTGTMLSLVGSVLSLSPVEATRWLRDRYGDGYVEPRGGSVVTEMEQWEARRAERARPIQLRMPVEDDCIGPRGIFHIDWRSDHAAAEYMRGRGFDPVELLELGYGYDSWTERVTIPIRRPDGRLVGFKGRTINSYVERRYDVLGDREDRKPRYDVGYGFDMHDTRSVVYGLDGSGGRLVLVEGELDRDAVRRTGHPAGALGTAGMTVEQERLIRCCADSVVLFLDTNQAGFTATWGWYDEKGNWRPGIVERLSTYMPVSVVDDHEGDPASMGVDDVAELIEGARSWMSIAVD